MMYFFLQTSIYTLGNMLAIVCLYLGGGVEDIVVDDDIVKDDDDDDALITFMLLKWFWLCILYVWCVRLCVCERERERES